MNQYEWLLKRNCCLSPRQLALAFIVLCIMSFSVALVFTLRGAWLIFPFALLEMSAVALAFIYYAKHATDHEHIELSKDCLLIELIEGGHTRRIELDPHWTRVALPENAGDLITLEAKGIKARVGRFVNMDKRKQFAQELRKGLSVQKNFYMAQ
jgi:uncharacterized membrane protein